jgi:hypothetical protein
MKAPLLLERERGALSITVMQTRTCIGCGNTYSFNPKRKSGASTARCRSCTKLNSRRKGRYLMLQSAGGKCRACGYDKHPDAINFLPSKAELIASKMPSSRDDRIEWAKDKIAVCLNCNKEINDGVVTMEILDSKSRPVRVAFYTDEAQVVSHQHDTSVKISNAIELEVVSNYEKIRQGEITEMRRANAKVIKESTIDMP